MAGRKQHYLPRFLQKGFATKHGKGFQTFAYQRSGAVFPIMISDNFAQRDFYVDENGSSADDLITLVEGNYASVFEEIRTNRSFPSHRLTEFCGYIGHIEMRTKAFFEQLALEYHGLLSEVERYWQQNGNENMLRGVIAKVDTSMWRQLVLARLNPQDPCDLLKINLVSCLSDEQLVNLLKAIVPAIPAFALSQISSAQEAIPKAAKSGMVNALIESRATPARSDNYLSLIFKVVQFNPGEILLPDTGLAFIQGRKVAPICPDVIADKVMLVPVASDLVVVGSRDGRFGRTSVEINSILSSVSHAHFISPLNSPIFAKFQRKIGRNTPILKPSERSQLNKILRDELARVPSQKI